MSKCKLGCECGRHRRSKLASYLPHIRIFIEAYTRGPHQCYFCGDEVRLGGGRDASSGVVHHLNHDHFDNTLTNLVAAHFGCHTSYHHRGRTVSDESRQRMSTARLSARRPPPTPETRAKISEAMKRYEMTDDHRRHLSDAARGRVLSAETRRTLSEAQRRHNEDKRRCECGAGPFKGNRGLLAHRRQSSCGREERDE